MSTAAALAAVPGPLPAERVRAHAAEVLRDGAYQTGLPGDLARPFDFLDLHLSPAAAMIARVVLAAAALVAVTLAVVWLVGRLRTRRDDAVLQTPSAEAHALGGPSGAATGLAAEGRFAEAIHALLLDTLAALAGAAQLAPSLTSREIVSHARLGPAARAALADLVAAVEVSYFGGATPGAGEYQACTARFQTFLATYRSGA